MRYLAQLILLLALASALVCCSPLINSSRTSHLDTVETGQTLTVIAGTESDTLAVHGNRPDHYKLEPKCDYYLVTQERLGHLPNTFPLFRTHRNGGLFFDYFVPVVVMITSLSLLEKLDEGFVYFGMGLGITNFTSAVFTPTKIYRKYYYLPELCPIPSYNEFYEKNLSTLSTQTDSVKMVEYHYESIKSYLVGKSSDRALQQEAQHFDPTNIVDEIQHLFGYGKDDINYMAGFEDDPSLKMSMDVAYLSVIQSQDDILWLLEVNTGWSWVDRKTGAEKTTHINSKSFWSKIKAANYLGEETKIIQQEQFVDAVAKALITLGNSEYYEPQLSKTKYLFFQGDKFDLLQIDAPKLNEVPTKVSEAVKSVVTIYNDHGHGSGCVISSDGYIITNYHVIENEPDSSFTVLFASGEELPATVVRSEKYSDLALLKVEANNLIPLEMCTETPTGERVFAIGTPADISLGQSLSQGIISASRKSDGFKSIQTDVKVSPGNSGGALINADGKLIGIVRMKIVGKGIEGMAFAIAVEEIPSSLRLEFPE